ncbi:MAG: membrane protein insertase YidC [Myxococcota bacterium]|nr:membrane protein insertase YidC [Myxococcota bacterium]
MDRNTLLAIALSLLVLSAWSSWEAAHMPPPDAVEQPAQADKPVPEGAERGDWPGEEPQAEVTRIERQVEDPAAPSSPGRPAAREPEVAVEPWTGGLESELFRVGLDNRGAGITSWKLLEDAYTISAAEDSEPVELVTSNADDGVVLATPLEGLGIGDLRDAVFRVEGGNSERVVFVYERGGVQVRKTLAFDPESYVFDVELEIGNNSGRAIRSDIDVLWPAATVDLNDFREQSLIALANDEVETEMLASVGSGGFLGFFGGGDEGPTKNAGVIDWAGVSNRYFLSVLIPNAKNASVAEVTFLPIVPGERVVTRMAYPGVDIPDGGVVVRNFRAYMGPKVSETLASVQPGLERSIDLGWSWIEPLTRFFHWFLALLYGFIPNYGVAIILVTIIVRVVTFPIMQKQMKSMERMRELQPALKEIQEKHKEDRQRQSEAMMKLYREEGVNPLGGCFPMLLQFPVFIGLFYALQSTIALRHADFALWINDLSAPEELFTLPGIGLPVRLLPVVMGASMFLQQRMTPMTGMDPVQARMMTTVMPIMMTVLFYQFPSGLVLYWMISNFLGIGHQLWVRKQRSQQE